MRVLSTDGRRRTFVATLNKWRSWPDWNRLVDRFLALSASFALVVAPTIAHGQQPVLPTNGTVAAGNATIGTPSNGTLTINQTSDRAIINWQSFSVGVGGTVNFNQPSASSATLNRVTGDTPSSIAGTINAPGTVLLVNPNGIAITKTGVVNVGSFAASTLDIKDKDFMAGNYTFSGKGASMPVTNAGRINVSDGGFAALLGGKVANDGIITARVGRVGLGSGELITLDLSGDGFLSVGIPTRDAAKLGGALISNKGKIVANGGIVHLSAATAAGILRDAVNVPGSIRASSVGTRGGKIIIGGDYQGGANSANNFLNAAVANAFTTTVEAGASLRADGTAGEGGRIVVWSDDRTSFAGAISATGTTTGGFAEVSGHRLLDFTGAADLTGPNANGTLLLDPRNVTISSSADSGGSISSGTFTPSADNSILNVTTLQNALASGNVVVTTGSTGAQTGDITVANTLIWSSTNTLTLSASHDVNINATITATNGGLTINATNAAAASGAISVGQFTLQSGAWSQNTGVLPGFAATSFTINGGSFLRVAGGNGLSITPYQIADIYGLQGIGASTLKTKSYVLANDIDASGTANWNSGAGFVPVGSPGTELEFAL